MINIRFLLLWAAFAVGTATVFLGCGPGPQTELLLSGSIQQPVRKEWQKYGAYYEVDEVLAQASYVGSAAYSSRIVVHKRVRFLTRLGLRFSSFKVPRYSASLLGFEIDLSDASGTSLPVEAKKIKKKFLEEGVISVPHVKPGCLLTVKIEFGASGITALDHRFVEALPVARGRFTLSFLSMFDYAAKEYGGLAPAKVSYSKGKEDKFLTWGVRDLLPRQVCQEQVLVGQAVPGVSIVMRALHEQALFEKWGDITKQHERLMLEASLGNAKEKLKAKAQTLAQNQKTPYQKANAVFHWVQDSLHVTEGPLQPIRAGRVLKSRTCNQWEMARCKKCLPAWAFPMILS